MANSQFRRSAAADTRQKGKGWTGGFRDRWKVPVGNPTPFLLIKGDYADPFPAPEYLEIDPTTGRPKAVMLPYYKFRKHTRSMKKNGKEFFPNEVCSAGMDPHNPKPCVGCFAMDTGDKSINISDSVAIGVVHLAFYHGHPVVEDNGGFMQKKDNSGLVLNYDECGGRNCNYCRVLQGQAPVLAQGEEWPRYNPQDITTSFGRRRYIEVGKSHLSNLMGWDMSITSICGTCLNERNDQVALDIDTYTCPTCRNIVIDMGNDPRTDPEIADAVAKPYPCLTCQRAVILNENCSCTACGRASQLSIHDVVLHGSRQGEGMKSQLMLSRFQTLPAFERAMGTSLPPFLGDKTFSAYIENLSQPFDFDEVLKPRTLADQAKRLELPLPGGMGGAPQQGYAQSPQPGYNPQQMPQPGYQQPQQGYQQQPQFPGQPMPMGLPQQQVPQPYAPYPQQGQQQPQQQQGPGPLPYVPPTRPNFS